MLKAALKKKNIKKGFVGGVMIDDATRTVASFEKLMATYKRYHSIDSNIGISKNETGHCRQKFQRLMKLSWRIVK